MIATIVISPPPDPSHQKSRYAPGVLFCTYASNTFPSFLKGFSIESNSCVWRLGCFGFCTSSRTHFSTCLKSPSALVALALLFFWRFCKDANAAA